MGDCLVHSPTLEQHLLDVAEALETFRRRQLFAKTKTEVRLWAAGARLPRPPPRQVDDAKLKDGPGVSVDPRKVQSIVEWVTMTPTCQVTVRHFTGLANYHRDRRFAAGS